MKITKVYTEQYRWPKAKPIANGKHVYTHNDLNLLVIETDEGITGYGCSWAIEFAESMGRAILGEDPLNNERLWQKTYVPKFIGRRGTSAKTVSAIDMALWDIKAKAAGMPLYRLLGGFRESVPCYVAGGYYAKDKGIRELQQEMEEYLSWGHPCRQDEGGRSFHAGRPGACARRPRGHRRRYGPDAGCKLCV